MGNQCIKGASSPSQTSIREDVYIEHYFDSRWNMTKTLLGKGGFSEVYLCHRKRDNLKGAVKIFTKSKMNNDELAQVRNEVSILRKLHHPNIVRLIDYFDEKEHMYVVLEYLEGGALFDRISTKKHYTEQTARDLVYTFLSALKVCHDNDICHRDIKPENLVMNSVDDDADVKLCDFGLSITLINGQQDKQICGTPQYIAPEMILQQGYGKTVDLWAVGCLTYILLAGLPPFLEDTIIPPKPGEGGDPHTNLWRAIITGDYSFPNESFMFVSPEAIDLIKGLLQTDPRMRLTVDQALDHRWVRHDGDNLAARHLGDNLRKFKAFRGRMKLRGIVKGIIAVNRFKNALGVKKLSTLKEARASLVPGATGDSLKESSEKKAEKVEKEEEEGGEGGEVVASEGIEVTV